jgi:FtsP/CotA-like multicopper oxidase with cupredoxin domain
VLSHKLFALLAAVALIVPSAVPAAAESPAAAVAPISALPAAPSADAPAGGMAGAMAGAGSAPMTGSMPAPMTAAERQAAAVRAMRARVAAGLSPLPPARTSTPSHTGFGPAVAPSLVPDYFGTTANYANSPLPVSVSVVGDGTGAAATAVVTAGSVTRFTVTAGGTGYTFAAVTVIGGGGSGAAGTAVITGGVVRSITATAGGTGYGTVPGSRKFTDTLPGLGRAAANDLGQYIPIAVPDTTSFAGGGATPAADYYEIAVIQYTRQLSRDLPATTLRGYVQIETPANAAVSMHVPLAYPDGSPILNRAGAQVYAVDAPQYLGPLISATRNRPVRVTFTDYLPKGTGGDLFLPVDPTLMGAGMGPDGMSAYSSNRATLHLHGGVTPWISDGTQHQWTTPSGSSETYPKGVSVAYVPDQWYDAAGAVIASCAGLTACLVPGASTNPGDGSLSFYYTNQQSARLMFYHDHSYGITRLNVYAGEAAGYLISDPVENTLISGGAIGSTTVAPGTVPSSELPLVIEDKTFVPSAPQLAATDPTWDTLLWGAYGHLWFPHVYMPNQNPSDAMGANAVGRWDYGPWFWPPNSQITNGPVPNPLCATLRVQASCPPGENVANPGIASVSAVPESFMDTMTVNGTVYPTVTLAPKAYRLRILNASNDRTINLQLYYAKSNLPMWNADGTLNSANAGEVAMVPAVAGTPGTAGYSADITDGRAGGVPDARKAGPAMIQIGNEGGLLPAPAVLPNTPIGYNYNRRDIVVLNVTAKTLMLGPAERADVIVDLSKVPAGSTLILYNDAPAPVPAFDPRYDYYTGDPDQTSTGGAPTTQPGYGPNTRTVMQIRVAGAKGAGASLAALRTALPAAYAATQPAPIIPEPAYDKAFGTTSPADPYTRLADLAASFSNTSVTDIAVTNTGSGYTAPPVVTLSGGGGSGASARALLAGDGVAGLVITSAGTGFTSPPTVTLTGGGGTGATAAASISALVASFALTAHGAGYSTPPVVTVAGGGGSGATATAVLPPGPVTSLTLASGGGGYTAAPAVTITGDGSGATATAVLGSMGVWSVTRAAAGAGYTSTPRVVISGGHGTGAKAVAVLGSAGLRYITTASGGVCRSGRPTVTITGGGGTGARAVAVMGGFPRRVLRVTLTAAGRGYTSTPRVSFSGACSTLPAARAVLRPRAVASIRVTAHGTGYRSAPRVVITGGGGHGARGTAVRGAPVASVTLAFGGTGFNTAPAVSFSAPQRAGGILPAATAVVGNRPVASVAMTAPGAGYTSPPSVSFSGGGGTGAAADAVLAPFTVTGLRLLVNGYGYTSAPSVDISGGGGSGATATASFDPSAVWAVQVDSPGSGYISAPSVAIAPPAAGTTATAAASVTTAPVSVTLQPKGIQELFDPVYGRMNATMSVEIPNTNGVNQTTIPYGNIDPPTEIVDTADAAALSEGSQIDALPDGTQVWRFTHNGVDTHAIHFHMFNVQVINRIGWDGAIHAPDANELGWKDTVRMNPLEITIIAIKPIVPSLPWPLPNSIRPEDPSMPLDASGIQFTNVDPTGKPIAVHNALVNFGWEYVFHCHLLGHEENDMMRTIAVGIAPVPPSGVTVAAGLTGPVVSFTDNSPNETGFILQRSAYGSGVWTDAGTLDRAAPYLDPAGAVVDAGRTTGTTEQITDTGATPGTVYLYRVIAVDVIGDTVNAGFPSKRIDSAPSLNAAPFTP